VALDAIRDQPRAVALLRRAIDGNRVAHAYAFVGPPGSGRMTTALAFAQELLSERQTSRDREAMTGRVGAGNPLGQATHAPTRASAPRYNSTAVAGNAPTSAATHPDLHVLQPTPPDSNPKGARTIRIGAIRELERQAALRPVLGGRRVFILDEAERMTGEAPEAFLKFLEEPPAGTVLILILSGVRAVPATVISRCQVVRFQARDVGRAAAAVAEALGLVQAARAEGAPGLFRRTDRLDRDRAEALVDGCWLLCRDLLLARAGAPPGLLSDAARAAELSAEAALWTDEGLRRAIEACRHARETLINNVTPRLAVETVVGRLLARAA
jgi:DNA polymerase III subunit delta'